jgi:AraC family transcriptional activator FtrA
MLVSMLRTVVTMVFDGVQPFELGVACEAFGTDRSEQGLPRYDFRVASQDAQPIRVAAGFSLTAEHRFEDALDADLVIVPASQGGQIPEAACKVLRSAHSGGAGVMSLCSGAFGLGQAGLLAGRHCTTHWRYAAELARRFPTAVVDPNVLYVCDDRVYTSAGTAAGLDLCLHLMRLEHGAEVANAVARRMVIPPHRDGGQAQYIELPVPENAGDGLSALMDALMNDLAAGHTVSSMASRVNMSPRTFARRFQESTGTTPHSWLLRQRVEFARRMLEASTVPIELVAERAGFGTSALLRHHFLKQTGVAPTAYRRSFNGQISAGV